MRKRLLVVSLFLFLFLLSSCQQQEDDPTIAREGRQVSEVFDENFKLTLYSKKDLYAITDEVDIWATIEYIGSEKSIDIYSGEPYAGFIVESEGVTYISNMHYPVLKTTTLEKGLIYEFPMKKVGGYSEDAEDADFWRDFYSEERMLFPAGEYHVTFLTDFYTDDAVDFQLVVQYEFEVS